MKEIWKGIEGYEGLYAVSNFGNVRSIKSGKILKPGTTGKYLFVVLCNGGKRKDVLVHRIVAKAFCTNKDEKPEVNHINEIKTDNRAENLEWYTHFENLKYNGGFLRRAKTQMNNKRSKSVVQKDMLGNLIATYPSIREMNRQTGFDRSLVVRCINGKCHSAYGYRWHFGENTIPD